MTIQKHFVCCPNLGEFATSRNQPTSLQKHDLVSPMGGLALWNGLLETTIKNENTNLSICSENYNCGAPGPLIFGSQHTLLIDTLYRKSNYNYVVR